jgi:futalosine hydrolase
MRVTVEAVILVVAATARELEGIEADSIVCGIGPVEAAAATARALTGRLPAAVLHVGIAGARGIAPPAIVLGSEAIYCDLPDELAARFSLVKRVEPAPKLLATGSATLPEALVRPIATSARVGGGTGYDVEAMEGFAVLRAAQLAGVPALELRAIANDPDEPDRGKWQFAEAFAALAAATERLLEALR